MMLAALRARFGGGAPVPRVDPAFGNDAPAKLRADSSGLEAGRSSRRMSGFLPSRDHVNTLIAASGQTTLARARYLTRNNGYALNAVEVFAGAAVGAGIVPSWKIADAKVREAGNKLWKQWTDEADAEGLTDFYGLQRRAARELMIAGEVFVRLRYRKPSDGLSVPLQLQMLPSEMLDVNYTVPWTNGTTIRQGIEFDRIGRRVAYHFWRRHPGDSTDPNILGDRTRVPAEEVLHIVDPVEAGQIRGLTKFTAAVVKMWALDSYDDSELERKKTAALLGLFITREDPNGDLFDEAAEAEAAENGGIGSVTLEPGTVHNLLPGEKPETMMPADSGNSYEPFQYRTLLQVAVALGIPYYTLTGDLRGASYGSQRGGMLEFKRRIEAIQHSVLVFLMCRPVRKAWTDQAVLSGALKLKGYDSDPAPWLDVDHIPPVFDWIDPLKDIQAAIIAKNAGLTSRTAIIKGQGQDPEAVDADIKADKDREARLGLSFSSDTTPPKVVENNPDQPPPAQPKQD